jgi:hypothetical protein
MTETRPSETPDTARFTPGGDCEDLTLAGVEFIHEGDSRVTARHIESGVASFGDTETESLRELADALDSHSGEGEPIDDPDAYLAELGIDVEIGNSANAAATMASAEVLND